MIIAICAACLVLQARRDFGDHPVSLVLVDQTVLKQVIVKIQKPCFLNRNFLRRFFILLCHRSTSHFFEITLDILFAKYSVFMNLSPNTLKIDDLRKYFRAVSRFFDIFYLS